MWSKESQSYVLTWVGAIIGVFGLIVSLIGLIHPAGFPVTPPTLLYVGGSSILFGAIVLTMYRVIARIGRRPDLETVKIVKALTIHDRDGKEASLSRIQTDHVNRKVTSHTLTVGGITSSGQIQEIRVDGEDVPSSTWEKVGSDRRVTRVRYQPFEPGQTITREITMKAIDSFPNKVESLAHDVSQHVKTVVLEVNFPADRKPSRVTGYLAFGNQPYQELKSVQRERDGTKATLIVNKPQLGGSYKLEWEW